MIIRRACEGDTESILNLLSQVLEVHAWIRPDLFISGTTKYSAEDLARMEGVLARLEFDDKPPPDSGELGEVELCRPLSLARRGDERADFLHGLHGRLGRTGRILP